MFFVKTTKSESQPQCYELLRISNVGGMRTKAIDKLIHVFGSFENEVNVDEHWIPSGREPNIHI